MSRYHKIIEAIFVEKYKENDEYIEFVRDDIILKAKELNINLPKNLGDVIYSFKYRSELPELIKSRCSKNREWVLKSVGKAKYCFMQVAYSRIAPDRLLHTIKIPDATPHIVKNYSLNDEQALLAKVRSNRLVDLFTGAVCYSLQNHLRTAVPGIGQIETDEIYIGIDKNGKQCIFPVQAKSGKDEIGIAQIEQDFKLCEYKYSNLICIPIAVQFMDDGVVSMFSFTKQNHEINVMEEKHYKLLDI